jgi:uncharacterized protein YgiB involved in biofilm formation
MKAVVILIIAGISGFMAYLYYIGECPGGVAIRSEQQCSASFNDVICKTVFSRAKEVAENSATVFMNPIECSTQFGTCLDHAKIIGGYSPRPVGFCVRASGNSVTAMEPLYQRFGVR